jgi:hypothetical protein
MIDKKLMTDLFLTKESFEQYSRKLREEKAKEYGLTLEQWDEAVATLQLVSPITQPPTEWNGPTSSFNG